LGRALRRVLIMMPQGGKPVTDLPALDGWCKWLAMADCCCEGQQTGRWAGVQEGIETV